jgi:hypothetical protein
MEESLRGGPLVQEKTIELIKIERATSITF